jgi:hypothetical protein
MEAQLAMVVRGRQVGGEAGHGIGPRYGPTWDWTRNETIANRMTRAMSVAMSG